MVVRIAPPDAVTALPPEALAELAGAVGADNVLTDRGVLDEAGQDWWPLTLVWVHHGDQPALPAVVVRPASTAEVAQVLEIANRRRIPVTPFAGRSGVCGASLPVCGGISLDMRRLNQVLEVDADNLMVHTQTGVLGPTLEQRLREQGLTHGHFPQSIDLASVGGWIACRGAGQFSNRYGKIEDIVRGLEVVLPGGRVVETNAQPAAATGPDLMRLFVGAEGTLGVVTSARLQVWPAPQSEAKRAWSFPSFADGLTLMRQVMRRGARPACMRLYDGPESARHFGMPDTANVLVVLAEGDPAQVAYEIGVLDDETAAFEDAKRQDDSLVDTWLAHRNDVSALHEVISRGIVVDTIEVAAPWTACAPLYDAVQQAIFGIEGSIVCTAHSSHAYLTGACLYFTFAGTPGDDAAAIDAYYDACWDAAMAATRRMGGTISHHHGIGVNRARFMADELGAGLDVLRAVKSALDPNGIMNPGKLGLGPDVWPSKGAPA
jgi:alkyldihydroxyacetonephosphate synthase